MSVLVTGGAGFIGSHMALELLDAGEDVFVLDNLSTGFRWAVPDGAKFIEQRRIVLVALDNPFTDPVNEGQLQGKAPPPEGTPPALPFVVHHHNLAVAGIHQIQNADLGALARDRVWTSCTMILPLRSRGGAGSPVRPVAIGAPNQ